MNIYDPIANFLNINPDPELYQLVITEVYDKSIHDNEYVSVMKGIKTGPRSPDIIVKINNTKKLKGNLGKQTPESIEKMLTTRKNNNNWLAVGMTSERAKKAWETKRKNNYKQSPEHIAKRLKAKKENLKNIVSLDV